MGIDVIARDLYFEIDNTNEILYFNKAVLDGNEISFTVNPNANFDYLYDYLNENALKINISISYSSKISPDEIFAEVDGHEITLKKRKLVVGIGCRRGKECVKIHDGLKKSFDDLNLPLSRIDMFSSAEIKKDEIGLLELSDKMGIPINFVDLERMKMFESKDIQKSEFVKSKFGIYGVCEPSALITAGFDSKLIYKKTSYNGVTIAVAISK